MCAPDGVPWLHGRVVAEHHFFWDGWTNPVPTNPLLFGAFIAGQTKKLKLAQCGVCLPDWHPIRAAEDVSMLDHMSNGRVEFGALPGVNNRVNGNFNRNADRRNRKVARALYWETLEIIQLAWKASPSNSRASSTSFRCLAGSIRSGRSTRSIPVSSRETAS